MSLAVRGIGLVSPAGTSAREHVFFTRAGASFPRRSPFLDAEDRRIPAAYCASLGARAPLAERLARMAHDALDEAMPEGAIEGATLLFCGPAPHDELEEIDLRALSDALARRVGAREVSRFSGETGAFAAIGAALRAPSKARQTFVLVAVDSFISVRSLRTRAERSPSPYADARLDPGEGAAAIVLVPAADARASRSPVLGEIDGAATANGLATDDNDEVVDGSGMTAALRALPELGAIATVFGQSRVDGLRRREWELAVARNAARFHPEHEVFCLEEATCAAGSAAGAMSLAYAVAVLRHAATGDPAARGAPFCAWAISRDGTRGAAIGRGAPA